VRYGLDAYWTGFYEVDGSILCDGSAPFDSDPNYGNLHSMWSKECQCEVVSIESKVLQGKQAIEKKYVGVATRCEQDTWCECPGGRVRMGSVSGMTSSGGMMGEVQARWTDWIYVGERPKVLCSSEVFAEVEGWENTANFGKYCECERVMTPEGSKKLEPGLKLYAFRVGLPTGGGAETDAVPSEVLSPKIKQMVHDLANRARDKSAGTVSESRKQGVVTGVGVAAGATLSAVFAPLIIPVILHGGFVASTGVVIGSSAGQYVATTGIKHGTKFVLDTEDKYENMLSLQDGMVDVGISCATAGLVSLPGVDHAIREGATHGVHAGHSVIQKIGDHAVIATKDNIESGITAIQFSINKIKESGMLVQYEEDGTVSILNPDQIPTIMAELTGIGILLNIILNNVYTEGDISIGHGAYVQYPEMDRDLVAMRNAAKAVLQETRSSIDPAQADGFVRLGVAERLLAQIVNPTYTSDDYKSKPQGKRFPNCMDLKVRREVVDSKGNKRIVNEVDGATGSVQVPLCYCWKHGFDYNRNTPVLGVDVDFCIHGQRCAVGSGVENAVCVWQDSRSRAVLARMFQAAYQGFLNCFGQHLDGYRCAKCSGKVGQPCMTETGQGVCQNIPPKPGTKKQSSFMGGCWAGLMGDCKPVTEVTCLGSSESIDANGRKSTIGASTGSDTGGSSSSSDSPCTASVKEQIKTCQRLAKSPNPAMQKQAQTKSCQDAFAKCQDMKLFVSKSNLPTDPIIGFRYFVAIIGVTLLVRYTCTILSKQTVFNEYELIEDEI